MKSFFLQITNKTMSIASSKFSPQSIFLFWKAVSIIEFIIITLLLFLILRKTKLQHEKKDRLKDELYNAKKSEINMNDLMNSINQSKDLYKLLSTKCHPDRFVNTELENIANSIFQEITKNRRNYNKLNDLKTEAENKLKIKI